MSIDVIIPAWTETLDHIDEALASLDLLPGARPIVVFNGPDADKVASDWWDAQRIAHVTAHLTNEYIASIGGGCYQCQARNEGLRAATAPYVAFLDADDFFLPGIAEVAAAAEGHRGAWGGVITAWADGSQEERRLAGPPSMTVPHHGCYVLRRDACPDFDVWAPHQVTNRGVPYGYRFWGRVGDEDIVMVDVDALVYRHQWSDKQASLRYWENSGFLGENRPWPTA